MYQQARHIILHSMLSNNNNNNINWKKEEEDRKETTLSLSSVCLCRK
jgi:hypothetical protein